MQELLSRFDHTFYLIDPYLNFTFSLTGSTGFSGFISWFLEETKKTQLPSAKKISDRSC